MMKSNSNESLHKHLAQEVMGYEIGTGRYSANYRINAESKWKQLDEWKPSENINQAMMCFKALGSDARLQLLTDDGRAICDISRWVERKWTLTGGATVATVEEAISLAIARATRWEK